jgi:hypothetical protein
MVHAILSAPTLTFALALAVQVMTHATFNAIQTTAMAVANATMLAYAEIHVQRGAADSIGATAIRVVQLVVLMILAFQFAILIHAISTVLAPIYAIRLAQDSIHAAPIAPDTVHAILIALKCRVISLAVPAIRYVPDLTVVIVTVQTMIGIFVVKAATAAMVDRSATLSIVT